MEALASDKQLAFAAEFRKKLYRRYVALGGNRSGKTVVCGGLCFSWYLLNQARNGDLFWVVSPTFEKSIQGPQKFLWEKTLPPWMFNRSFDEKNGFDGQRPIITINLPNKRGTAVLNFKTSDQKLSTFESDAPAGIWCDEALPYEVWQRLIPRTIDRAAWILYSDIPEQDWHWFDLVNAPPEAKVRAQIFSMYDNELNLPAGEISIAAAGMSKDQQDMRIWGKFRRLSGVVFREYDPERHDVQPFPVPNDLEAACPGPRNWPKWRFIDVGGSAPTVCLWVTVSPSEKFYFYRIYYQPHGHVDLHAKAILEMSEGEQYVATYIDPAAWQETTANEVNVATLYQEAGIPVEHWPYMQVFGERAAVERMKRRFENDQIGIFRTLDPFRRELAAWKYKCDSEGNPTAADAYENGNNHAIDCAKAACALGLFFDVPKIEVAYATPPQSPRR